MHEPLHVRPLISEPWLGALDPWVVWDDDEAEVALSSDVLDGLPTVLLSDEDPQRLLDQGFAGVVSSNAAPERVAAALRAVANGLQVIERHPTLGSDRPELTGREREVLELLSQGFSNREIGDILHISAHTAKFHVQGLLEKLDATSRTEAAVRAARMFMI